MASSHNEFAKIINLQPPRTGEEIADATREVITEREAHVAPGSPSSWEYLEWRYGKTIEKPTFEIGKRGEHPYYDVSVSPLASGRFVPNTAYSAIKVTSCGYEHGHILLLDVTDGGRQTKRAAVTEFAAALAIALKK
jgi:hypothetical protein